MKVYLGTFLIAFTTLALEVTLVRLLSVIAWYHLAFFAIATALLGMTAGATTVYLKPSWFTKENLNANISRACLGYALVIPFALLVLLITPLGLYKSAMAIITLLVVTLACSVPFYFSGIAITAVLTKHQLPIGKLYASDLIGASLGSLFVLKGLEVFDAPSLILLCGSAGALAALTFAWHGFSSTFRSIGPWVFVILAVFAIVNSATLYGLRPLVVKGKLDRPASIHLENWNSFSRIVVNKQRQAPPHYWGPSPLAPKDEAIQYGMTIDGAAGTVVRRFSSIDDLDYLRFDVTNVAYYLRPSGGAMIIGVGGGRDIHSAILFGHERIVGIDVNPIFIDLLEGEFREFAGIADRPEVTLVVDEARSYLSRADEEYAIVQMSLIDTWAATGAGAFSLSENGLYTIEAWQIFMDRLSADGIFTVSRWYNSANLGETGRVVTLAVAALIESGVTDPSHHIAMATSGNIATVLLSKEPFSVQDIARLDEIASELQYELAILPGIPPSHQVLNDIVSATSMKELRLAIAGQPLNYEPPTDENPYFFNTLRLSQLRVAIDSLDYKESGVLSGNVLATLTLLGLIFSLFVLAMATIVFPLVIKARSEKLTMRSLTILWPGALYFSLIGAGFMFVEIALIQRLSVFLSNPIYALGILLFTIIASTGIGSFASDHLPLTRRPWVYVYPIIMALAIISIAFILPILMSNMITSPIPNKIVASILVIFPLGILMGFFFPMGMRLVRSVDATQTPWYWALNGIFGVLCSALAVFISIYVSISTNFYIAAICYATILISVYALTHRSQIAFRAAPQVYGLQLEPQPSSGNQ